MGSAGNEYLEEVRKYWNRQAKTFDDEPDHGLNDPAVRAAWLSLLSNWQPEPPARILDIGCGTGSISLLLAQLGHQVVGIDLSPKMIDLAKNKASAASLPITFKVMDAAHPEFPGQQFNGIVCRHLLWSLAELPAVLARWINLLSPGGRLLFIEGYWAGGGLRAADLKDALPSSLMNKSIVDLRQRPELWGKAVDDERYAILAEWPGPG